jgi:hypothetical protein
MANPTIKVKRSAVSGKIPTTSQIDLGEFAINTFDGKVYIDQDRSSVGVGTTVIVVNPWSVGTGTNTYNTYFTNGNVGIGSTLPTSNLHVVGNTTISGVLTATSGTITTLSGTTATYSRITADAGFSGNINATGISTATTLSGTTATYSRITANAGFSGNIYSTGISTISGFRFPSSDGTNGQFLKTDGSGNLSWATATGSGGAAAGAATTISDQYFTATAGQTAFTSSQDLTNKSVQVFLNGIKLRGSTDFTVTVPTTVTLVEGAKVGDRLNLVVSYGNSLDEEYFTATQGQTSFSLLGSLASSNNIKVYVNGVKLRTTTDYGTSSSVTLVEATKVNDEIDLVCDNAEDYFVATAGQITFVPTSNDISGSNLQVFLNGVKLENNIDYTVGSPAITLASSLNAGDQVDVVITRS